MPEYRTLPNTDEHGNYWFNDDHKEGPAIFPHKVTIDDEVKPTRGYSVYLSRDRGFLTGPDCCRLFYKSPTAALRALNDALNGRRIRAS
jgi:hypothetical protein